MKKEVDESSDDGFGGKFRNGDDLQSLVRALRNSEVDPMSTYWLILKVAVAKVGKMLGGDAVDIRGDQQCIAKEVRDETKYNGNDVAWRRPPCQ